jgi:hypothetical protein
MKLVHGKQPRCQCGHASSKHTQTYGGACSIQTCACPEFTHQRTSQWHLDYERISREQAGAR